jgi:hypothetical protein
LEITDGRESKASMLTHNRKSPDKTIKIFLFWVNHEGLTFSVNMEKVNDMIERRKRMW